MAQDINIKVERKQEALLEEMHERAEESFREWFSFNEDSLLKDFVKDFYESEFKEYARTVWLQEGE